MKNRRYIILSLSMLLICFVAMPLHAQTSAYQKFPYGIGIQFSPSTWGLSYHQRFDENALQGVFGLSYDPDPLYESVLAYSVAIEYQRTLFGNDFNEYLGGQLYASVFLAHTGEIPYDSSSQTAEPFEAKIIVGAGFGVEVLFFQNFSLPIEFIYNFSFIPTASNIHSAFSIDLIPKIALRYRFA
ncbi:MAG: hypothetical protein JEY71_14505 [Sphaerochaeta sp.]|nr:hypothetical protein [Sphaerochaeta sp.]